MSLRHIRFAEESIEQELADEVCGRGGAGFITLVNSMGHDTWWPDNAMNRLAVADDRESAYIEIVEETIGAFYKYATARTAALDEPLELPVHFGTDQYIAEEAVALSDRIVKGALNEITGVDWIEAQGHTVMTQAEAVRTTDEAQDATDLEEMEIDAKTMNGETWQIKSSESEARKVSDDIDNVLIVDEGEVERFR